VLVKDIKGRLKGILVELCEWLDVEIIEGAIASDHVHMYVSVPPKYSPAQVMRVLKGKSSEYLRREFPELRERYWGMHIWARGYFVSTVGIDREVIRRYVKAQQEDQMKEEQLRLWRDSGE
jgi:putative transposase